MKLGLRAKIFLVILSANLLTVGVMGITSGMNFKNQFLRYVNEVENRRTRPLIENLSREYVSYGSWDFLKNNERSWQNFLAEHEHLLRIPNDVVPRKPGSEISHRQFGRNLLLADSDKNILVGRNKTDKHTFWLPINILGKTQGYLGVIQNRGLTMDVDRLFVDRIRLGLIVIFLGSLVISLMFAIPFSYRLVKPILEMKKATHKIASGNFLSNLNVTGHDELAQLAQDINVLAKTLEANQKSRQQWVADISHELRTPIAVSQAEIESMLDGIRPVTTENLHSLADEIKRLSLLVEDLHQLSLSDAGALTYKMERVDLGAWLKDFIQDHPALNGQMTLIEDFPAKPVWVQLDTKRCEQLFGNLLNNSLKYTDLPGELLITVSENAKITWSDSAPSVPPSELGNLFERLYRVESSRNRESGGSGLGLAICANIVAAHNGTIFAEKSDLNGLSIIIELPEDMK